MCQNLCCGRPKDRGRDRRGLTARRRRARAPLSRRRLLGGALAAGPALAALHEVVPHQGLHDALGGNQHHDAVAAAAGHTGHGGVPVHANGLGTAGPTFRGGLNVDHDGNGFNPTEILRDFDYGKTKRMASGRTLREWTLVAADKEIEIAPGVKFPAWTYDGRIPGPIVALSRGRQAAGPLRERLRAPAHGALPRSASFGDGRGPGPGRRDHQPGQVDRLRVRRGAVRAPPLPLPRRAAGRAHRARHVRDVHRRSQAGPRRTRTRW